MNLCFTVFNLNKVITIVTIIATVESDLMGEQLSQILWVNR